MNSKDINELFRCKGLTLGSVESFTGGKFASEITSVPGASHFFKGALVTYATEEKVRLLGIPFKELDAYGVCSIETAMSMASKGKNLLHVDCCVSFTGNAGPSTMEYKKAGQVYIGIAIDDWCKAFEFQFDGDRNEVQMKAISKAYDLIEKYL